MEITNFFIAVIVYVGLVFGLLLKKIAKEEIKLGKKYLISVKNVILTAIIFILLYDFVRIDLLILFSLIIFTLLTSFSQDVISKEWIVYLFFAVFLYFSFRDINIFYLISSLMFFYGLVSGSLVSKKQIILSSSFVVLAVLLIVML